MPLSSTVVGECAAPVVHDVTLRDAQAYAAAIGDTNPRFFDDAASGGVMAPPPFCVSLEWPAYLGIREIEGYGVTYEEALRGVHGLQDSIFHRPVRPGDQLRTQATLVQVRRIRPGAFSLARIDTVDAATGEGVVTSYYGSVFRGVAVDGSDRELEAVPDLPKRDTDAVLDHQVRVPIAREAAHIYTECARIWNPIHTERTVALAAGLPDIILHGTASWALAGRELIVGCANSEPARLLRLVGRFRAMIIPGSTATLAYASPCTTAAGDLRVDFALLNESGEAAVAEGVALLEAG